MKFRSHTMWMILAAMLIAVTMTAGRQPLYSFAVPEVIETQIEKDIGMAMDYAISFPILKLPCSFYSYDAVRFDFLVCLKSLRIRSTDFIPSYPAKILYHVIAINGP